MLVALVSGRLRPYTSLTAGLKSGSKVVVSGTPRQQSLAKLASHLIWRPFREKNSPPHSLHGDAGVVNGGHELD